MITISCIFIISGIFFGDLWIKNRIETRKIRGTDQEAETDHIASETGSHASHAIPSSLWGNRILIRKYHNRGAMLNLGQDRRRFVAVLSVLLCVLMTAAFLLSLGNKGSHLLRIGLSMLLGGAFSNTYDRLKRKYVVDYFSFNVKWEPLRRVIFNLSDFCIMVGAMLAVLGSP